LPFLGEGEHVKNGTFNMLPEVHFCPFILSVLVSRF